MKRVFSVLSFCVLVILTAGCSDVRTYVVEEDRVDQNLASGNQGFLSGTPKVTDSSVNRKLTRKTYVTEVEIGGVAKAKKKRRVSKQPIVVETVQEPANAEIIQEQEENVKVFDEKVTPITSYVVQPNDTLESISQKVYGTPKKWKKIFEANQDQLKSPDKIYAGEALKIVQE